ncbi:hypothetical protein Hte_012154 [Hypoxylon texense]
MSKQKSIPYKLAALALSLPLASSLNLNVTAIGARDGSSTLECWQMDSPFDTSSQPGTSGTAMAMLSGVSNLWVMFTAGLAYITLPNDANTSALVPGGQFGLIFAADTRDVTPDGHRTQYPGVTETIALQIPTRDGKVPAHSVVHMGPCTAGDVAGVREFALEQATNGLEARADNLLPFPLR